MNRNTDRDIESELHSNKVSGSDYSKINMTKIGIFLMYYGDLLYVIIVINSNIINISDIITITNYVYWNIVILYLFIPLDHIWFADWLCIYI